ncbi:signal transduction protein [Candidatus Endobugula sertula]|uniref:Cytochrome c-type biogenesis protein n=1 Tax=Candidatus Endobugula sertula TaxID=62101 RepID=A0A1D2QNY5_9GAMM|nr:signal transduction protein [Candidatus Endobugula sertula]
MKVFLTSLFLACFLLIIAPPLMAVVDLYEFDTESQRQRYHALIEVLRCPKCQNQNLAGSDSPVAEDLRRELHQMLLEGKTDREIKTFMVDRYGEFVLYKPRFQKSTVVLWGLPLVLLVLGLGIVAYIVRGRQSTNTRKMSLDELSSSEQDQLKSLLKTSSEETETPP